MKRTHLVAIAVIALLSIATGALAEGKPGAAAAPAKTPAERLAALIKALEEADHPTTAMAAYARGCAIDRSSVKLQDAYMRKMLRSGLPKIAFYAARVLVRSQPDNATAWGVVAYIHGKRGEPEKALDPAIRAVAASSKDASIAHNAGQLVAWYENQLIPPKLPDSTRRTLDRIRPELFKREPFAQAYRAMKTAYDQRAKLAAELGRRVAAAEEEAANVQRDAVAMDAKLRSINDEIDDHRRRIDDLYRELRTYYYYLYPVSSGGVGGVYQPNYYGYRQAIYERIRAEERMINQLKLQVRRLRREGKAVLVDLSRRQAAAEALRKQVKAVLARVDLAFRWDPPGVDGVVTPEVDRFPLPPTKLPRLPEAPAPAAAQQLELARLYLRNDMEDKAKAIIRQLIAKYGSTKVAHHAKILLMTLQPMEE
jgi:hypothetical protein